MGDTLRLNERSIKNKLLLLIVCIHICTSQTNRLLTHEISSEKNTIRLSKVIKSIVLSHFFPVQLNFDDETRIHPLKIILHNNWTQ